MDQTSGRRRKEAKCVQKLCGQVKAIVTAMTSPAFKAVTHIERAIRAERKPVEGLKRVVVAGRGNLGNRVHLNLHETGYEAVSYSRKAPISFPLTRSHMKQWHNLFTEGLPECDAVIQTTGASIMDRALTEKRIEELRESRMGITRLLASYIKDAKNKPKTFVHASCVGIYPYNLDEVMNEGFETNHARDMYAELLLDHEEFVKKSLPDDTRIVHLRFGHVLSAGGLLGSMKRDMYGNKFWGRIGGGAQWLPWIHVDDAAMMCRFAIDNEKIEGVLNGVAPQMATQRSIPDIMKEHWQQPLSILPLPTILANWKFGDRAPFMLRSQKVSGDAVLRAGFEFQYPTLPEAIKALEKDLRSVKYVQPPLEEWEK